MAFYFYLVILAAAMAGFSIAWYIHHHKKHSKVLVCPLNSDCEAVVHSDYSKFFGVALERWGMIYYGVLIILYTLFVFVPQWAHSTTAFVVGIVSVFAFLFSLYLTYVQYSHLKNWCVLCLASALCSTVIFLALVGNWLL